MRVEPAAAYRDGECVLSILAARFDALVAEDAFRVVAYVELVVDLHGLSDCGALTGRAESIRSRAVTLLPARDLRASQRHVDRRLQKLEHHAPACAHALGVGLDLH